MSRTHRPTDPTDHPEDSRGNVPGAYLETMLSIDRGLELQDQQHAGTHDARGLPVDAPRVAALRFRVVQGSMLGALVRRGHREAMHYLPGTVDAVFDFCWTLGARDTRGTNLWTPEREGFYRALSQLPIWEDEAIAELAADAFMVLPVGDAEAEDEHLADEWEEFRVSFRVAMETAS